MLFLEQLQLQALELVVHDARAVPQQHVGAGLLLDVAAEVAVGGPQDLLALGLQVVHHGQRAGTGHHPVGARLHGGAGVGVDDDGAVGMGVAEGGEVVGRAAEIERAGGVEVGHQHALARRQDLGGLAHEAHAGHHQGLLRGVAAEAGHLEGIGDAAAGLESQVLQVAVHVVVGDQRRVVLPEQFPGAGLEAGSFVGGRGGHHLGPGVGGAGGAGGVLEGIFVRGLCHGCIRRVGGTPS